MAVDGEVLVRLWEKLYVGASGDHYKLYIIGNYQLSGLS